MPSNHKKDKPWDDGTVDKWHIEEFTEEDNKGGAFAEESNFVTLFPKYRESYIQQIWPEVEKELNKIVSLMKMCIFKTLRKSRN